MSKLTKLLKNLAARALNAGQFKQDFLRKLPPAFHPAARLLFYPILTAEERRMAAKIEGLRNKIPSVLQAEKVASYTSPHSGTFQKDEKGHALSGAYVENSLSSHMKTGSGKFKGMLLKRIAQGYGAMRVLELGTNTGLSGSYFLAAHPQLKLTTIEGSADLCKIAQHNLAQVSSNFRVMNALFDDAIDTLIAEGAQFDCVFIDGQHEKEATLHYAMRVAPLMAPNAIYIFDDIYWSDDMNDAWKELLFSKRYAAAVDFFAVGVCEQREGHTRSTQLYDMGDYLPRPGIYRKNW